MTRTTLVLALAGALGCGGSKHDAPKVDVTAEHVAAVNAAMPADLKGKLEFELGKITNSMGKDDRNFKLARPKGWKAGFMPGEIEPADADNFGSATLGKSEMQISSNCDGACEKKDWEKVSDKVNFAQFTSGQVEGKVLKDVKTKTGRTLVFERKLSEHFPEKDVAINIVTAWWVPDGARYFTCDVELGAPLKGAADAFEKACSKVSAD
ncbi:MAG: hypothetical protein H0T89_11605 [Deltaproteobacteria bacterium]|nr:hypothetical protein [Deltaproteobacteria bacterium]